MKMKVYLNLKVEVGYNYKYISYSYFRSVKITAVFVPVPQLPADEAEIFRRRNKVVVEHLEHLEN